MTSSFQTSPVRGMIRAMIWGTFRVMIRDKSRAALRRMFRKSPTGTCIAAWAQTQCKLSLFRKPLDYWVTLGFTGLRGYIVA